MLFCDLLRSLEWKLISLEDPHILHFHSIQNIHQLNLTWLEVGISAATQWVDSSLTFSQRLHLRFGKGCRPEKSTAKSIIPETHNRNHVEDLSGKVDHLRTSFVGRSWLWWVWHYSVLLFGIGCASSSLPRRSSRRNDQPSVIGCHRVRMVWYRRSWQAMVDSAKKTTLKDDIVPVFVTVGKVWSYAHCSRSTEKMRPWCSKCIQMQLAFEGLVAAFFGLACWLSSWGARCLCHFGHWESPHGGSCILDVTSLGSLAVCSLRVCKGWRFRLPDVAWLRYRRHSQDPDEWGAFAQRGETCAIKRQHLSEWKWGFQYLHRDSRISSYCISCSQHLNSLAAIAWAPRGEDASSISKLMWVVEQAESIWHASHRNTSRAKPVRQKKSQRQIVALGLPQVRVTVLHLELLLAVNSIWKLKRFTATGTVSLIAGSNISWNSPSAAIKLSTMEIRNQSRIYMDWQVNGSTNHQKFDRYSWMN